MGQLNQPSAVPSLTVGGRVFTDLANLKILKTYTNANSLATARLPNASAGYQVPVGKKFTVLAVRTMAIGTTAQTPTLAYSDNDVGFNSASALTNPVYEHGTIPDYFAYVDADLTGMNGWQDYLTKFEVPAGKYLSISGAGGQVNEFFGYEETA